MTYNGSYPSSHNYSRMPKPRQFLKNRYLFLNGGDKGDYRSTFSKVSLCASEMVPFGHVLPPSGVNALSSDGERNRRTKPEPSNTFMRY